MDAKISRLTIDLPKSDHKKLKAAALMLGTSMKHLVLTSVDEFLRNKGKHISIGSGNAREKWRNLEKIGNLEDLLSAVET